MFTAEFSGSQNWKHCINAELALSVTQASTPSSVSYISQEILKPDALAVMPALVSHIGPGPRSPGPLPPLPPAELSHEHGGLLCRGPRVLHHKSHDPGPLLPLPHV